MCQKSYNKEISSILRQKNVLNFQLITHRKAQKSILLAYMPHESVKESNRGSKEGLGPTYSRCPFYRSNGVPLQEVSIKRVDCKPT